MDKYEDQSADVLLRDLIDLGKKTTWTVDDQMEYDEDIAAIKIAVIREASVGTCHFYNDEEDGALIPAFTIYTQTQEIDGVYDLIPKATP